MKANYFFKALALAMVLPAMLLTTSCIDNEIPREASHEIPVTLKVARQISPETRATYTDNGNGTGDLAFSTGDKLFVKGTHNDAGVFAGTLTWQNSTSFSGTIFTQNEYSGTANVFFAGVSAAEATLLPAGYENYNFLVINNPGTYSAYCDYVYTEAFVTSNTLKATAVEQLSLEKATYSGSFALAPQNAILNFTITGLTASTEVAVAFSYSSTTVSKNVTTDGSGNATFAIGVPHSTDLNNCTLTVAGNPVTLVSEEKLLAAGKIYNITRAVTPPTLASVFNDGATVLVKANTNNGNYWYGVTGTYNASTSEYATTSCGSSSLKTVSMTKDGNNLVVFMQSNYNQITITFNTTNNTYKAISTSSAAGLAINTFTTLIVNGVDITSTLTAVPSETITLTGGSDMGENTYSGTHFQVTGQGDASKIIVNKWKNMVISAKNGKTIVEVVFSYYSNNNLNALTFSSGTFNGSNMVENVNATSLTVSSTNAAGTHFNGVTIYYSE